MATAIRRSGASTIVGLLACQEESFLKTLCTSVVACNKVVVPPSSKSSKGTKDKTVKTETQTNADQLDGGEKYEIEFENTVLFPEGGGQPCDFGIARTEQGDEIRISNVVRDGLTAVHVASAPIPVGSQVDLSVDWARRFDHMQQHTGQHLLSAVLDKIEVPTLGWNLGSKFNYIELPRKLTSKEVESVQTEVNRHITSCLPIKLEVHQEEGHKNDVDHKVPANYDVNAGVIRVIHIGDLDSNPCCGTHLTNTGQIGSMALLHAQPIRGTNSRLFFVAGNRVHMYASELNEIVKRANSLLSCQTEDIEDKIGRLNIQVKELSARERQWQTQVAQFEAAQIRSRLSTSSSFYVLSKPDASQDYLRIVDKELGNVAEGTVCLMCGAGKQGGSIIVVGSNVDEWAAKIKEHVPAAKGGGKGKWQAKVPSYEKGAIESICKLANV